jgi:hypothetical protein
LDFSVCGAVIIACRLVFGSRSGEATQVEESDPISSLMKFEEWLECRPHLCLLHNPDLSSACEQPSCEDQALRIFSDLLLLDKRKSSKLTDYSELFHGRDPQPVPDPPPIVHPAFMEYKDVDIIDDVDCLCEVPDLPPQHPSEVSAANVFDSGPFF